MTKIINIDEHKRVVNKVKKILDDENLTKFECQLILDSLKGFYITY